MRRQSVPSGSAAGTQVRINATITYYLSTGSGKVQIPTGLIGQSRDAVQASLESLGLNVSFTEQSSSDVAEGNVINLDPGEGSQWRQELP